MTTVKSSLIGKAGELLVAAELMRRGVEVAHPASDIGVDLLAYKLRPGQRTSTCFVPIQVKASSGAGYAFERKWFDRATGLALVQVWNVETMPEFYVFANLNDVIAAIGNHARTTSWITGGNWSATIPSKQDAGLMLPHRDKWDRIINQLGN